VALQVGEHQVRDRIMAGIRGPRRKGWPVLAAMRVVGEVAGVGDDDDHRDEELGWLATRSSAVVLGGLAGGRDGGRRRRGWPVVMSGCGGDI
jgi:hypothetical protein